MRKIILKRKLAVRLPHWTNCVVEIEDVGTKSFWGRLIDIKTNEVVKSEVIFPSNDEWHLALDADTVIKNF